MDKASARRLVEQTFHAEFEKGRFSVFLREILNRYEERSTQFSKGSIPDAFKPHVKSAERLGVYKTPDDEVVDLLVVRLEADTKLARARTALRNFGAYLLNRDTADAALIAFVSPDGKTWRFSYVRLDLVAAATASGKVAIQKELTPARRLSFLVGESESCHTAQSRFLSLLTTTTAQPTLSHIEAAFNVEAVTEEFFEEYKELFLRTKESLDALCAKDKGLKNELASRDVSTVDLAKKLLGQIVFLYFIQKKGWLGGDKGSPWGSGPTNFLRQLFRGEYAKFDNFFDEVLEPLFYDSLATDRGREAWDKRLRCRIPFLNGGLFEPLRGYDWENTRILLPNLLFSNAEKNEAGDTGTGILDVFDRYNFTVNESEPLEKEVAIDPEMLGKVFENLLEVRERKSKGSFYTPREIVHYMCQEALISYLEKRLIGQDAAVSRDDLEALILDGDHALEYESARKEGTSYTRKLPAAIERHAASIDSLLSTLKVCDPAIGSGAFPVGMMTEIVRARLALSPYLPTGERSAYHFKRDAIQQSLYGVDIDPAAVEIAKLRLWLSLVVDEDDASEIQPLPNLDYKVVVGDSLVRVKKNLFNQDLFKDLERLKPLYFNETQPARKRTLKATIDGTISSLTNRKETFDFEIYFSEVFRKGGFDIVIANPPYISVEKFARTEQQARWKRDFRTYASRGDVYCFFYERALSILRDDGFLVFISSNKFQRAGYGKALRQELAGQHLNGLIDFCELPVFAASTDPMIVMLTKRRATVEHEFPVLVVKDEGEFPVLRHSILQRSSRYRASDLKAEGWSLEGADGLALVEKIRSRGVPLSTYVNGTFSYGIKTGYNKAFVIDGPTRSRLIAEDRKSAKLIKPWLRGKDIGRWQFAFADLHVIVFPFGFHTELRSFPAILRHLTQHQAKLKARGQCTSSRDGSREGQHHWLELDNNPSESFLRMFDSDRVVLPIIKKKHGFSFVPAGYCSNDKTTFFLSPDARYVLSVLNCSITEWLIRMEFPVLGDPWAGGRIEYRAGKVKLLPIPDASRSAKSRIEKLALRAENLAAAEDAAGLREVEEEIDREVAALFQLSAADVRMIQSALAGSRHLRVDDDDDED